MNKRDSGAVGSAVTTSSADTDAAVSAHGLQVHRGRRPVLRGIDLCIPRGQVTGLLGPSGCGKTTLMRSIVGVQRIASGELTVLGDPAGHRSLRTRIGYVTQAPSVYEDLTVAQNLRYFATVVGAPASETARVLEAVGMKGADRQSVSTLSGGQLGRVSLAAGMLGRPPLLILDEPTVGLDPLLRTELWDLFSQLASAGSTILVSSHVMDEAVRCDHLLLMREGRILAADTPRALLAATGAEDMDAAFAAVIQGRAQLGSRHARRPVDAASEKPAIEERSS
jgi:ABC-2 type transport system ATP-binding protein